MKITREQKVINIPRIKVLRRKTVDVTPLMAKIEGQYMVACVWASPLAIWKLIDIIKELIR